MAILTYNDPNTTWDALNVTYDGATGVTPPPVPPGGGAAVGNSLHSRPDSRRYVPPPRPLSRFVTQSPRARDEEEAIALMLLLMED